MTRRTSSKVTERLGRIYAEEQEARSVGMCSPGFGLRDHSSFVFIQQTTRPARSREKGRTRKERAFPKRPKAPPGLCARWSERDLCGTIFHPMLRKAAFLDGFFFLFRFGSVMGLSSGSASSRHNRSSTGRSMYVDKKEAQRARFFFRSFARKKASEWMLVKCYLPFRFEAFFSEHRPPLFRWSAPTSRRCADCHQNLP